jgi:hypothetical protein
MKTDLSPMANTAREPVILPITGHFAANSTRTSFLVKFFHEREAWFVKRRKDLGQKSECLVNTFRDAQ